MIFKKFYWNLFNPPNELNRPFLDLKNLATGKSERLFRCDPNRYEYFVAFAEEEWQFIFRSESATEVPNYYMDKLGKKLKVKQVKHSGPKSYSHHPF